MRVRQRVRENVTVLEVHDEQCAESRNQDINMNNGEGRELEIGSGWKGLSGSADKSVNEGR